MKPVLAATASSAASDEQLVEAARAGSDEAVEALFRRYHERITAYARGIVVDSGRAEDIVQETFMSAFRSLRATDREIVFKPWIYQIAKNACIDQLRRQGRTDEISIDSDDFKPQHEGRLSQGAQTTHKAVSQREDMHQLAQAFSGLPRSQHEVLVLRELEGRSYEEIASRLHVTRSAVESMLFRARRGLRDEYDEIATGERCRRTLSLIAAVAEGMGTTRDRRAISRHARLCGSCRHEAIFAGLGALVVDRRRRGRVRSAIDKAAALLPFPFLRRRGSGSGASSASVGSRAQTLISDFSTAAAASGEQAGQLAKAVAAIVATAVIAGGGVVGHSSAGGASVATSGGAGVATAGGNVPGGLAAPGAPGQPPSGSAGLPTTGGTNGPPGFGALVGGSQNSTSALSPPSASSPLSPSLLPPALGGSGGGGGQGGGVLGGLALPGGGSGSGSVTAPNGSVGLPSIGGIQLPGTQSGGGGGSGQSLPLPGLPGSGSTQLPKLDTSKVTGGGSGSTPSLPKVSTPSLPKVSTPSVPSVPKPSTGTTTVPSAPSVPRTPSIPDTTSTTSSALGTAGAAAQGATGVTGPILSHIGL